MMSFKIVFNFSFYIFIFMSIEKNEFESIKNVDNSLDTVFENYEFVDKKSLSKYPVVVNGHYIVYIYNKIRKCTEGPALQIQDFNVFLKNMSLIDIERIDKRYKEDTKFEPSLIERFPDEYTIVVLGYLNTKTFDMVHIDSVYKGSFLDLYSDNSKLYFNNKQVIKDK